VKVLAGNCLIVLLIGMFLANVNAVKKGVTLRGKPATPLWLRTPLYRPALVVDAKVITGRQEITLPPGLRVRIT
jgi:hypothetical protein